MRIFLSGNEDVAKWHLPVAQSKVAAFADECRKKGLKQNRFTFLFEETGAIVEAQYAFGQVAMQIHAPVIPLVEEEVEEQEDQESAPKTFWVSTTKGYFWVEVRYVDGVPEVILTQFEAIVGDSFVYPGMSLTAPGMISGCFVDSSAARYVLSQSGGVMSGEGERKGTIESTAIADERSRLTVVENVSGVHDFIIMKSDGGQSAEVRRIRVMYADGAFSVERGYASVAMAYEGETSLQVANLLPNPAWVHRKCNGSYFSPNKTIGYHVDIGADDGFLGNLMSVSGADLLDNTGGFPEAMFNHTPDLYRFASLLSFPAQVAESSVDVILVSPTMGFSDDPSSPRKCWGGYELTQDWASCADYRKDFDSWILSPRFVLAKLNMRTGERTFEDLAISGSANKRYEISSWDDAFGGAVVIEADYSCDTDFYSDMTLKEAGKQCSWSEGCVWTCDTNDPGSTGQCPKGWTPYSHWEYFSRENIRNSRHAFFLFGHEAPALQNPSAMQSFYFLFDGFWHLDIGVLWSSARIEGDYCGLCAYPYGSQEPGELVYFSVQGADTNWILAHGHEYATNMEIVTPLGYIPWPLGGSPVGFIAKVPEEYEAPHSPVLMKGGVSYPSQDVPGVEAFCERSLMSDPCMCSTMTIHEDSAFLLDNTGTVEVVGGCPPFEWSMRNANVSGKAYVVTEHRSQTVAVEDECTASLLIKDACGNSATMDDAYSKTVAISGETVLDAGDSAHYTHNLDDAVYVGTLELVEEYSGGAILRMPSATASGSIYTAAWVGKCNTSVSMDVTAIALLNCPGGLSQCEIAYGGPGYPIPGAYYCPREYETSNTEPGKCLVITGYAVNMGGNGSVSAPVGQHMVNYAFGAFENNWAIGYNVGNRNGGWGDFIWYSVYIVTDLA